MKCDIVSFRFEIGRKMTKICQKMTEIGQKMTEICRKMTKIGQK